MLVTPSATRHKHHQLSSTCNTSNTTKPNTYTHWSPQTSLTTTSLGIARVGPVAYTICAAIRRRRIAAISALSPPTASFGARTKIGPSTVQCTVTSNAVYKAAKYVVSNVRCDPLSGETIKQISKPILHEILVAPIANALAHQAIPAQRCVLHALVAMPTQFLPPFAGAGSLHVLR